MQSRLEPSAVLGETVTAGGLPRSDPDRPDAVPAVRKIGPWARFMKAAVGEHTLALVDQAVVSGTSFVTTILIGRWCSSGELGVYALGVSLLVTWACVQESLIALPYTIHRHRRPEGARSEYAGSVLAHQGLLSALTLAVQAAMAAVLSVAGAVPSLVVVAWALVAMLPFALLREFGRRFAFAHLRMAEALALDVAVAVVQLAGLAWLASTGRLSAGTALAVIGVACGLTGAVWLYRARGNFVIRRKEAWSTLRPSWALGKWLFASQITLSVQAYFIHWLLACLLGMEATGVYAACLTVVLFSNPLTLGLSNALAPRTAQAYSEGGGAALRRVVFQTTLLLGTAMAVFCAVVIFAGEDILRVLYNGSQYAGQGHTVAVLSLAMLVSALGMPASGALATVERPDLIFKAGLWAVVLSTALIPCLVVGWGVTGAAYGFLAGNVAGSLGRWAGFLAFARGPAAGEEHSSGRSGLDATVIRVMQHFIPTSEPGGWVVEPVSEGAQASIVGVRRHDGRPLWQTHLELVVKVYKPAARSSAEVVRGQFASLSQCHARLNDRTLHGWKINAPAPLYHCEQPLALVMTRVPGASLTSCLKTSAVSAEALDSIARAVVGAMERFWSADAQIHGDLNFDNILCDPAAGILSFVDPGILESAFLCDGVSKRWYPASRDLAYLLYDTGVAVKKTLANPAARRRQERLAEGVLRVFLERAGSAGEKTSLLDETQACVRVYLNQLRVSSSPRGVWHLLLRRIASHRIEAILARLRGEAGDARGGSTCREKGREQA